MHPVRLLTLSAFLLAGAAHAQINPEVNIAAGDDWNRLKAPLRDAIECKAPLKATPAVRKALHVKDSLTGDYKLPEPLTVYGTLKVTALSIFDEGDGVVSYTVKPAGLTLAEIGKAGRLKKEKGGRYFRAIKGGHVEASEGVKGEPVISCGFGENPGED
jgi:hypothetical protein